MQLPALGPDDVHYLVVRLPAAGSTEAQTLVAALRPALSADEQARSDKFLIEQARVQFVAARVALRCAIAHYCGIDAATVTFAKAERGKPYLAGWPLRFSVSHSGRVALLAFARDRELGIDVEQVWDRGDPFPMADRYFSPAEVEALTALPHQERRRAFFYIWARKEAYIKARGDGLYLALDSFDVTCGPHPAPRLLASREHPEDVARFTMYNVPLDDEYPAALMVERAARDVAPRAVEVSCEALIQAARA